MKWNRAPIREQDLVHFMLNEDNERLVLFESHELGENKYGYDTLNNIINKKLYHSGKNRNQAFVFGKYDENEIYNNYDSKCNIKHVMLTSDYIIWLNAAPNTSNCAAFKVKIETFINHIIWRRVTDAIKEKFFHVADSLKKAAETFNNYGIEWIFGGCRRGFVCETLYTSKWVKVENDGKASKIKKTLCGISNFDPNYPVIKRFFEKNPSIKDDIITNNYLPLDFIIREKEGSEWEDDVKAAFIKLSKLFKKKWKRPMTKQIKGELKKLFFGCRYLWGSKQFRDDPKGKKETEGLRGDVDPVPKLLHKILKWLQDNGMISKDVNINIVAVNAYDYFVGLKSHWDDKFIEYIWSFVLGEPSRLSFDIKGHERGIGLCSIELPSGCTTQMDVEGFTGKYPSHKVIDAHIIGPRLCALFRTVLEQHYRECKRLDELRTGRGSS